MKFHRSLFPYLAAGILLLLIAIFSPWLTPQDPYAQDLAQALMPPSADHLLGTDRYGRDILSRIIIGSQTTLCASLLLLIFIALTGSLIGALCGLKGGRTDILLMRLADVFLAFPEMVFAIAVAGILGGGLIQAAIALALIGWPKYARLARGLVLTIRSTPYFAAARMSGTGKIGLLCHHVFPNIAGPILVTAALNVGTIIMELAGLSFLGLGVKPPEPEWGLMLNTLRTAIYNQPLVAALPGVMIFITSISFNLFSDGLRSAMEVRQ